MKTIKVNDELYQYILQPCLDCNDFAVMLDLGNGKPDCIGYASNENDAKNMIAEEIATLSE